MKPLQRLLADIVWALLILCPFTLVAQKAGGDRYPKDSIYFELNTIPYLIDSGQPGNCWQAGHPSKALFNEAYSAPLAILTDTSQPYPVNTTSSFSFMIIDTTASMGGAPCGGATYIEFMHRYDTDTLADFGTVEYSFDNGSTWKIARDTTISDGPWGWTMWWWDWDYEASTGLEFQHMLNPSGRSNGWIRSRYTWQWFFPVKAQQSFSDFPDTITVRFTFHSDGIQNNREGWMIDNIVTGCMDVGSGVNDRGNSLNAAFFPNPLTAVSTVRSATQISNPLLEVYDPLGKSSFRKQYRTGEEINLEREDFNQGIYFWRLTDGSGNSSAGKLVVE